MIASAMQRLLTAGQHSLWGSMLAAGAAYFAPMYEIFTVMMAFVAVDLVAGILASRKAHIPCNSRRLRQSVTKLVSYIAVMMLVYAAERAFSIDWLASYKFLGGFICFVELVSILENLATLTEKPVFLKIIRLIRGNAKEKHGTLVDDILDEKNKESPWTDK